MTEPLAMPLVSIERLSKTFPGQMGKLALQDHESRTPVG
jgi:hypothetical protein